jgi:formamidopyrimidine-DNA glycosylase
MPELPEVETIVRDLKKTILGKKIENVWTDWKKMIKKPANLENFKKEIKNKKIEKVWRRGKNILFDLSGGKVLLIHQKLTGHLLIGNWKLETGKWIPLAKGPLEEQVNQFIHLMFWLDNGKMLALSDLRKFAKVELLSQEELKKELSFLGLEPLEKTFTFEKFKEVLPTRALAKREDERSSSTTRALAKREDERSSSTTRALAKREDERSSSTTRALAKREDERSSSTKKGKIKQILMNQEVIAGIGNIYSDEILWKAKVHPLQDISKLTNKELQKIYQAIKKVLTKAIKLGGTSISDYRRITGERGYFQKERKVYQRENEKCLRCGVIIKRIKLSGRSAYFCPICQRKI